MFTATYYKDGIRNLVGNTIDRKTCVAVRVGDMPNAEGEIIGSQSKRVYSVDGKSVPLQARPNGGGADGAATGLYAVPTGIAWRGRDGSSSYEARSDQKTNAVTAEFVNKYFRKGKRVALTGSIQVRKWKDKEGNDRKTVEVVADSVEFADGKDQGAGSYAADQMAAAADQQFTEVEDDDGELPF